ncbi:DM13 domain-containing protein [Flagellimonas meridianipacifica]|uniref:DM13 domain-containing protein n=1 Tax=Flagellimonas meridianipacifica TaxID=1080225 RepID=UPI000D050602|nr:DM13 domain-containing protein [Allomuricauda pacifica]
MKKYSFLLIISAFILVGCDVGDDSVSLSNEVPQSQECDSTHPLVGESRELPVSTTYGVRGTVTIVSDCEIRFTNFFYNGFGPAVSVYGANNGNFDEGISLSERLNGRRFEDETLTVFLPEGRTLDEINSFSIWCFEFDIDFSSVNFQ